MSSFNLTKYAFIKYKLTKYHFICGLKPSNSTTVMECHYVDLFGVSHNLLYFISPYCKISIFKAFVSMNKGQKIVAFRQHQMENRVDREFFLCLLFIQMEVCNHSNLVSEYYKGRQKGDLATSLFFYM